nr:hypothetical protein [uncultured Bacteroides sp.]
MYQLIYQLPKSKTNKTQILQMDKEQKELYDMVVNDKGKSIGNF